MASTIFTQVTYSLGALIDAIELGTIGLPDIQRPFVWKNAKVRDLFDSMYQGFPVGYFLFWENGAVDGTRAIGTDGKQKVPQMLIVDGQQRLTSLYAVIKGVPVVRENYQPEVIEIAFNPLLGTLEVADAAIRRDKSYLPNISAIWAKDRHLFQIVQTYLKDLKATRALAEDEETAVWDAFAKLQSLKGFPFTVLALAPTIDEEQVSEVFVRINSAGKSLNQADFILTLMSVFWDEGRSQLETFCRQARQPTVGEASPFNYFMRPSPDQLLRASIGLGFRRARLKSVYSVLRGKDLATERFVPDLRDVQFERLKSAQAQALKLHHWHDFFKAIRLAGYRSERMISSQNALIFTYTLYLIGRTEFGVDEHDLRRVIAQWFFLTALTGRYTSSPESTMEFDLARLRGIADAASFVAVLRDICRNTLTNDYWSITLPTDLATSSARSPSLFAYFAALNLNDARVLFSNLKVSELMDPSTSGTKASLERHHLYPRAHLASLGITDTREVNQIANFTVVEWGDNAQISDRPPAAYVPDLRKRFDDREIEQMYRWHALPDGWHEMGYHDFLRKRRELMAGVIREAYERLAGDRPSDPIPETVPVDLLVSSGEGETVEFKSTLRVNLHTGQKDPRMELAVVKTIAGFLNTHGGTLVIGVSDDGQPVGLAPDGFPNEDKWYLHLVNILNERIGHQHMMYIHPRFGDLQGMRVVTIKCNPARTPAYVKDGAVERFYVRTGAATSELTASQMTAFIEQRFRG